jgi:tetratricopeptide (TPR) repeat protein
MTSPQIQAQNRQKEDQSKKAIDLAMQSRWSDAAKANEAILDDFPDDLETYNRLGKALTEVGRIRDAKAAFGRSLELSPNNPIARKNLDRLQQLDDTEPVDMIHGCAVGDTFIEEIGKTTITALVNLAKPKVLVKEAPGRQVQMQLEGGVLKAIGLGGAVLGQIEPRLTVRLLRLMKGGNKYEAAVRSVGDEALLLIIREVYKHPYRSGTMSFPPKVVPARGVALPRSQEAIDTGDDDALKDWSNDDTEPGDDNAFGPVIHRIIASNSGDGDASGDD